MSDNRNRTRRRQVSFRCTAQEEATIDLKVSESGMTKTDYLIRSLSEHEIKVYPGLKEVLSELKRQGVNLNQALRYTHNDKKRLPELEEAIKNCNAFYSQCLGLWEEIKSKPDFHFEEGEQEE